MELQISYPPHVTEVIVWVTSDYIWLAICANRLESSFVTIHFTLKLVKNLDTVPVYRLFYYLISHMCRKVLCKLDKFL